MTSLDLSDTSSSVEATLSKELCWALANRAVRAQPNLGESQACTYQGDFLRREPPTGRSGADLRRWLEYLSPRSCSLCVPIQTNSASGFSNLGKVCDPDRLVKGTGTNLILTRLSDLVRVDLDDPERTAPSNLAFFKVWELLTQASLVRIKPLPSAAVSSTDDGGIRVQWLGTRRQVRLVVAPDDNGRSYIYYQDQNAHGLEWDVRAEVLVRFLDWFQFA